MSCTWLLGVALTGVILSICRDSFFAPGGKVIALKHILLVDEKCDSIAKCQEADNVFCVDHICACLENAVPSSDGLRCLPPAGRVRGLTTILVVGEKCNATTKCHERYDVFCVDHICACLKNAVPSSDGLRCLPLAQGLGDSCEVDGQCTSKLGDNSWCHDGVCDCTELAVPVQGVCEPKATDADPSCKDYSQCLEVFGYYSLCVNMECGCMEGYHVTRESKFCLEDKGLTAKCSSDDECFLTSDGTEQNVLCIDNSCSCTEGYQPSDANHKCLAIDMSAGDTVAAIVTSLEFAMLIIIIIIVRRRHQEYLKSRKDIE